MARTAILGMSGGLDSSAAAIRLKRSGLQVLGVFLQMHEHAESGGDKRLQAISRKLDIQIRTLDLRKNFAREVLAPFVSEYSGGKTPNPCVICNERVKFMALMETARSVNADFVATGHYARITRTGKDQFHLSRGRDPRKDQSYVLYRLPADWYPSLLFPLGNRLKTENRALARETFGTMFDEVTESADLCFLPDGNRERLLGKGEPGEIHDLNGTLLGHHRGLIWYTIGQRKGLGLPGGPWYVVELDTANNRVIVGAKRDLDVESLRVTGAVWYESPSINTVYQGQYRYRTEPVPVRIVPGENGTFSAFSLVPMSGVAPGQSLVLYDGERVVGGGFIERSERRFATNGFDPRS